MAHKANTPTEGRALDAAGLNHRSAPACADRWPAGMDMFSSSNPVNNIEATSTVDSLGVNGGYDAVESRGRRRPPVAHVKHADALMTQLQRNSLVATTQDAARNFAVAGWVIRKHLDWVCDHELQFKTGDKQLNTELEALIAHRAARGNFDSANRHGLYRAMRLYEAQRTMAGDVLALQWRSGHLQAIEGDRVRNATDAKIGNKPISMENFRHGVRIDRAGRSKKWCITRRRKNYGGYEFDRLVSDAHVFHFGYFDRFDQIRGVSPLASAINSLRDIYENVDYAMAKAKIGHLFGLIINSDESEPVGESTGSGENGDASPFDVNFDRGPFKLELGNDEKATIISPEIQGVEFAQFTDTMLAIALKSLDIPFSFYDESFTNFFGSRSSVVQYVNSCKAKRRDVQDFLGWWTNWQLAIAVLDGDLALPGGTTLADLKYVWTPAGVPFWDPAKEVRGQGMAIASGFTTFQKVNNETGGGDIYDNIDENAAVLAYAREKDFPLALAGSSAFDPEPVVKSNSSETKINRGEKPEPDTTKTRGRR